MEESAPKRRRTSARTSAVVDNNTESTTPPDAPPSQTPSRRRREFASPTKASLAKHNPDILKKRQAARPAAVEGQSQPASRPGSRGSNESLSELLTAQFEHAAETEPAEPTSHAGSSAATPGLAGSARRSPSKRLGGGLSSRPRRSPAKPIPRPLPPPAPDGDDDLLNPFLGRALNRTPPTGDVSPPVPPTEPELPPTPTEKGLADPVVTTPPSGIHNTPSKRPRRRGDGKMKSSPLKQPPIRPAEVRKPTKVAGVADTQTHRVETIPKPIGSRARSDFRARGLHPARKVPPYDPNSEKKQLRDSLKAQLSQMEADLKLATEENERIRQIQMRRRDSGRPALPPHRDELLGLLRRYLLPPQKEAPPDPTQQWFDAAMNPMSWLPFGSSTFSAPSPTTPEELEDLPPPVSHHPLPLTSDEELPFLQAFTPFTFTSKTLMLPRESKEAPLLRQHNITIGSTNPAGLFSAKIDMTVNTDDLTISELSVPRLDPSAVPELGPFIEGIVKGGLSRAMDRNVNIITWAMAEWYRIDVERAQFWCLLDKAVGQKEQLLESISTMRNRRRKRRRRDGDDADAPDQEGRTAEKATTEKPTKADLLPHIGRTAFEVPIPREADDEELSCLRIQWRIEFDWTGEAKSKVGVLVGMPGKWHQGDERGTLVGISKVFADLVEGHEDPLTAVRTVIALLAGDVPS